MTGATIGGFKVYMGTAASPSVMSTAIEEVISVSGVGRTNQLEDATNFDSPSGTKEFIAGLAEGDEVIIECNYLYTGNAQQLLVMAAVDARSTRTFRLAYINSSPEKRFKFDLALLGWKVTPSATARSQISFTGKISGTIVHP